MNPPIITLTSDFGGGPFVGLVKGVMLGICPQVRMVDLAHDIAPQDVMGGALVVEQALGVFPAGTVHWAVVDPGVGGQRRAMVLAAAGMFFVGPDNGIFTPVWLADPSARAFVIANQELLRHPVSATFHGRDVFAPVAARLAAGLAPEQIGPPLSHPVLLDWPRPRIAEGALLGRVVGADRFGNLATNLTRAEVEGFLAGREALVCCADLSVSGLSRAYCDARPGEVLALFDSLDRLELAQSMGDLLGRLGLTLEQARALEVSLRPRS